MNTVLVHLPIKIKEEQDDDDGVSSLSSSRLLKGIASASTTIHDENLYENCGNVFIYNNRKLLLICGFCDGKYANMEAFAMHLNEHHSMFKKEGSPLSSTSSLERISENIRSVKMETDDSGSCMDSRRSSKIDWKDDENVPPPMVAIPQFISKESSDSSDVPAVMKEIFNPASVKRKILTEKKNRRAMVDSGMQEACSTDSGTPTPSEDNSSSSSKVQSCQLCLKVFKRTSRLLEHMRVHTGEKPFSCDVCDKSFRLRTRLMEHKQRHEGVKRFKCDMCDMTVTCKQDLVLHKRHHVGDKRYACIVCQKSFVRSTDLKIHLRIHTDEKPYKCEICGKDFRANSNLIMHRHTHTKEKKFKCDFCDKCFYRNIDRTVHHRTHTGEKPFKCEICDKQYSARVHLRKHLQREHGGDVKPQVKNENEKDVKAKVGRRRKTRSVSAPAPAAESSISTTTSSMSSIPMENDTMKTETLEQV